MPASSPRRYTDDERANALAALAANAGNVYRTARQLGIPERTLRQWATGARHPESAQLSEQKRGQMADAFEAIAWNLLDAMPGKIAKAPLNHVATALGIAIDKMRLLRGEATSITDNAHGFDLTRLTDDQLDALDRILGSASPPAPEQGEARAASPDRDRDVQLPGVPVHPEGGVPGDRPGLH